MKRNIVLLSMFFIFSYSTMQLTSTKALQQKIQSIPGKVECEWYDEGGEGIAYHDSDPLNNGSGKLNPANGDYLNEFRMKEGVDISYTKPGAVDDNPYNKLQPAMKSLYVGWTVPGEWINYTVDVKETAFYNVSTQYTAHADGHIAIEIDSNITAGDLLIPSTYNGSDTVAWRQWHHWNRLEQLCQVRLFKGMHKIRLRIIDSGNMNFDYLEFSKGNL